MGRSSERMMVVVVVAAVVVGAWFQQTDSRELFCKKYHVAVQQRIHVLSLPWCKLYLADTIVFLGHNTFHKHSNTWLNSIILHAEWLVIFQISTVYLQQLHFTFSLCLCC